MDGIDFTANMSLTPNVREVRLPKNAKEEQAMLKQACTEFEGMMINILLKEGLLTHMENEEAGAHTRLLQETTIEHVSRAIATQDGGIGLGQSLYEDLTQQIIPGQYPRIKKQPDSEG